MNAQKSIAWWKAHTEMTKAREAWLEDNQTYAVTLKTKTAPTDFYNVDSAYYNNLDLWQKYITAQGYLDELTQ